MASTTDATPRERLASLADGGRFVEHDALRPSPHLGRFAIAAQPDDGVVTASLDIDGVKFEAIAQDARFLRGSVGESHGRKMIAAIERAREARCPLLVLAASGGVRLHEANAAEWALGRALRTLCDARAAGLRAYALAVGDVFGGMSVFVAACEALAMTPQARFGLSGPRVIASASDAAAGGTRGGERTSQVFTARQRAQDGFAMLVDDDAEAMRVWLAGRAAPGVPFDAQSASTQRFLAARVAADPRAPQLRVVGANATLAPFGGVVDAAALVAVDAALLALPASVRTLTIVEDSRGHEVSLGAEGTGLSFYLAHHALVIAGLRANGVAVIGVVTGVGHSAAFFANALQADRLYALSSSRIVAMAPAALAQVIGVDAQRIADAVENDPLLGHPARHFAAQGGLVLIDAISDAR